MPKVSLFLAKANQVERKVSLVFAKVSLFLPKAGLPGPKVCLVSTNVSLFPTASGLFCVKVSLFFARPDLLGLEVSVVSRPAALGGGGSVCFSRAVV